METLNDGGQLSQVKRKRGRPRKYDNVETRVAAFRGKFEPISWKPVYDQMVYRHCLGTSNIKIAEEFEYTPQQVSNILTCKKAKVVKKFILDNLRAEAESTIGQRLNDVAEKMMKRIETVAANDTLFEKAPLAIFDRGLKLLANLGMTKDSDKPQLPSGGGNIFIQNRGGHVAVLSEQNANHLADALARADRVNERHLTLPSGTEVSEIKEKAG